MVDSTSANEVVSILVVVEISAVELDSRLVDENCKYSFVFPSEDTVLAMYIVVSE